MEPWKKDRRKDVVMVDIEGLVPEDHLLRKMEKVMDYEWLYERLRPYYCEETGRPGTDPVVLIRCCHRAVERGGKRDKIAKKRGTSSRIRKRRNLVEKIVTKTVTIRNCLGDVHISASTIRAKYTKAKNMTSSLS